MARYPNNPEDQSEQESFQHLLHLHAEVEQWHQDHEEHPGRDGKLKEKLSDIEKKTKRSLESAASPMAVGIFGPSQVGKSVLIGSLCRPGGDLEGAAPDTLIANPGNSEGANWNGDAGISFLGYVNHQLPAETETTAVVTRFTTFPIWETPPQAGCFRSKFINHRDLVVILNLGYRADVNDTPQEFTTKHIDDLLNSLTPNGGAVNTRLRDDFLEALDLCEENKHVNMAYMNLLKDSRLREFLKKLNGDLSDNDWEKVASIFWGLGNFHALDRLYVHLKAQMGILQNATEVDLPWESVCRGQPGVQNLSVTSVPALESLRDSTADNYQVHTQGGGTAVNLHQGVIAALCSELVLPTLVHDENDDDLVMNRADVLDFPGVRPVHGAAGVGADGLLDNDTGNQEALNIFLRGKLTRLFDVYCRQRSINVLLLCVENKDLDVPLLSHQVRDWLSTRYPDFPNISQDEQHEPSLFLVHTKADRLFAPLTAIYTDAKSSFAESTLNRGRFFETGLSENNPMRWFSSWPSGPNHETHPFPHLFYTIKEEFIENVSPKNFQREMQLLSQDSPLESHLGEGKLMSHFRNLFGEDVFDPTTERPSNTGTPFLVKRVNQKLLAEYKREELSQIRERLVEELRALIPDYVANDLAAQQNLARQHARDILDQLEAGLQNDPGLFGRLLEALTFTDERVKAVLIERPANLTQTLGEEWLEDAQNRLNEITEFPSGGILASALKEMKERQLPPKIINTMMLLGGASIDARTEAISRIWNRANIDFGERIPPIADPVNDVAITLEECASWSRMLQFWQNNMEMVMLENVGDQGQPPPPGNDELPPLMAKALVLHPDFQQNTLNDAMRSLLIMNAHQIDEGLGEELQELNEENAYALLERVMAL